MIEENLPETAASVFLCWSDAAPAGQLRLQLIGCGYDATLIASPEALPSAIDADRPTALIVDADFGGQPGGGFETVRGMRAALTDLPVLFIAEDGGFATRMKAVKAGGKGFLVRPAGIEIIVDRLSALLESPPSALRVLLVDDDPISLALHAALLEVSGMAVLGVSDPRGVLTALERFRPDLVLMDIYMPGCSGRELAALVRQIPDFVSLPIIFLSSEADAGKRTSALTLGVDGFLVKPVDTDRLVSEVTVRAERMRVLRTLMAELVEARDQARRATRAKSAFLATMSNEMRSPMNGIITMAELMEETSLGDDQRDMLSIIRSTAAGLTVVINDILDHSKLEAGTLVIEPGPIDLAATIRDAVSRCVGRAEEKGVAIDIDLGPAMARKVIADGHRLRQILLNLIGNAVKFTHQGRVVVRLRRRAAPGSDMLFHRFEISDTGIGIEKAQMGRLFQPFEQGDSSISRWYGGTGLGLSTCKHLCELMGGLVGVESEPGIGSMFWFEVPLAEVSGGPAPTNAAEPPKARWTAPTPDAAKAAAAMVLVAEDNPVQRAVLKKMLSLRGIAYGVGGNGVQAMALYRTGGYGLLLTDLHMPEMSGFALVDAIRTLEADGRPRLPIVALTADSYEGTEHLCRDAGMDGFVVKPIDNRALDTLLERYLSQALALRNPA